MAIDPREALAELLLNYRDQSTYLERADRYFRAEASSVSIGTRVPPALARFRTAWPAVRVVTNAYADRVRLEDIQFSENEEVVSDFRDTFTSVLSTGILEALACGAGYVRTVVLDNGELVFSATRGRDGAFLEDQDTGEILATMRVHRPRRLKGLIAAPQKVTVYTPGKATVFGKVTGTIGSDPWGVIEQVTVPAGVLLMRPLINRARAGEPYGRAEARDLYALQDQGSRILTDLSVATDALAVPQRVLIATLPESISELSQVKAYTDSILALSGDVRIDQWAAAQLSPFVEALNGVARTASSTSGLPLSYWGIASEANAPSGDAIRENDSRIEIRARHIGSQWTPTVIAFGQDIAALKNVDPGKVTASWADPSTPTPTAAADAAIKLSQIQPINGQVVVDRQMIWDILRVPPSARTRIEEAEARGEIDLLLNEPEVPSGNTPSTPGTQPGS